MLTAAKARISQARKLIGFCGSIGVDKALVTVAECEGTPLPNTSFSLLHYIAFTLLSLTYTVIAHSLSKKAFRVVGDAVP